MNKTELIIEKTRYESPSCRVALARVSRSILTGSYGDYGISSIDGDNVEDHTNSWGL